MMFSNPITIEEIDNFIEITKQSLPHSLPLPVSSSSSPTETKSTQQLLQLKDIFHRCSLRIQEILTREEQQKITDLTSNEEIIFQIKEGQFLEPRGKFEVIFQENGLYLKGLGQGGSSCVIEWENLLHCILTSNPTPSKKDGEKFLFFILKNPITLKTKKLFMFCWILNNGGNNLTANYGPIHFTGKESDVVSGLTEALFSRPLCRPSRSLFLSSTNQSYIRCYKGVQEGVIFPLEQGILFFKPSVFIEGDKIAEITAGRGGSALTRYIDLKIETDDGKIYEYSNIDRDELPSIQQYVQYFIEKRKREEEKFNWNDDD